MPHDTALIGRRDEVARLAAQLDDVRAGSARTALVAGEAGVGKSRLLTAFVAEARAAGAHVLAGVAEEHFGAPMPYGPILDALEGFVRDYGPMRAAALGGPAYGILTKFFDLGGDPMGSQQQVFLAVRRMLDHIGGDAPVVLVLEDLHWADPSTLDLLRHLGQARPEGRRLLLLGSYRSVGIERDAPLLWQLLGSPAFLRRTERIELGRFGLDEVRELLSAGSGGRVDARLVRRCFEWSGGNPFFAEQLMAAGALAEPDSVRLSADLMTIILARLHTLKPVSGQVLRVAAVAGRAMSRRLLRTVSGLPGEQLNEALQECFDRQMLYAGDDQDVYRFQHALLREAVYQSTVRDARVDLHLAMARALTADPGLGLGEGSAAAELASHWYLAGSWPEALGAAVQAGRAAVRTLAFPSAEVQFQRALELWPRVPDAESRAGMSRVELLAAAADAARWAGHVEPAVEHIRRAVTEAGDAEPDRLGELHERLGSYLWEAGRRAESLAAYRQAAALLGDRPPSAVKARVSAALALGDLQAGRYAEGRQKADAALAMALDVNAVAEQGRALNISGLALGMLGDHERGEERLRQALEIARSVNHLEDRFRAYGNLGLVLENAGRLREAATVTTQGLEVARQFDLAYTRQGTVLANNASAALVLLGEWDEAERIITEVSLDRPPQESLYPRLTLAEVRVARGDFDGARELLASIADVEKGEDPRFLGPLHTVRAELALGEGDLAGAAAEVAHGLSVLRDGENTMELLRLCAVGMRCAADRGAPEASDELALLAGSVRGRKLTAEEEQLLSLCAAERKRSRRADTAEVWSQVAAGWAGLDRAYPAAYARWREAEAAGRDRDRAKRAAREAHRAARALGAAPLAGRVERFAARIGMNLAEAAPPLPYGLTPTEWEVLGYLYDGYDAARIAQLRGRSRRTVETQIGRVFRRLGVHNAVEAVAFARREGFFEAA
ncbi:AAA family ATPase [Couchioplanes caeruleus]|uniref:ATP-binding protein n=1 Tax=Couchioplanes caeruleus TaxID=56438 RepID=UPI0020BE0A7F|nr:AAA family ATPase [Couchioplanes caeruleus]UQU64288.1 AAA family ATPase [Couchioplanes caeruleus]